MAISTYAELKTDVADWLHRSDLTASIQNFVALAESAIARDIRVRDMEQQATGTLTTTTLALPTRFLDARRVVLGTSLQYYVRPDQWYPQRQSSTGRYTIIGDDFHFQASSGSYEITYWQAYAALSAASDTNWLLTNHPDVYLWATLEHAALWARDTELMAMAAGKYRDAKTRVNAAEQKARFGTGMAVRVDTFNTP